MKYLFYFFCVMAAAVLAAFVGGIFAAFVALISPEFVRGLFFMPEAAHVVRYAMAVGMIWGVFLGAGAMAFSLGLVTLVHVATILAKR